MLPVHIWNIETKSEGERENEMEDRVKTKEREREIFVKDIAMILIYITCTHS